MRRITLALIALTPMTIVTLGTPALAADLGKSVKSISRPVTSPLNGLTGPDRSPTTADLINANRAAGDPDEISKRDDRLYIDSSSDSSGSYVVQFHKKLFSF
jgi:hypothetical protein